MTARLLPLLFSILVATPAVAQRRTVMENLATTGTSIFISSTATRVGVGTSTPEVTLDVLGQAQFGTGTTRSTFTTTGALTLANAAGIQFVSSAEVGMNHSGNAAGGFWWESAVNGNIPFIRDASKIKFNMYQGATYDDVLVMTTAATGPMKMGINDTTPDAQVEVLSNVAPTAYAIAISSQNDVLASLWGVTGAGNVVSGGSVTASAFFGDGSNLSGITGAVAQATVTYNLSGATTETTNFKVCYGTGTLTLSAGTQVQVVYSGDITNSGASGQYCVINFLQDGAFISPASSTIGMGKSNNASAGGSGNATTVRVFPSPGAGSHSWCVSMISPFGATCTFTSSAVLGNQFSVTELR